MRYLRNLQPGTKQHLWNPQKKDTYCKMWSTDGIKKSDWIQTRTNPGRQTCDMCRANFNKMSYSPRYKL